MQRDFRRSTRQLLTLKDSVGNPCLTMGTTLKIWPPKRSPAETSSLTRRKAWLRISHQKTTGSSITFQPRNKCWPSATLRSSQSKSSQMSRMSTLSLTRILMNRSSSLTNRCLHRASRSIVARQQPKMSQFSLRRTLLWICRKIKTKVCCPSQTMNLSTSNRCTAKKAWLLTIDASLCSMSALPRSRKLSIKERARCSTVRNLRDDVSIFNCQFAKMCCLGSEWYFAWDVHSLFKI